MKKILLITAASIISLCNNSFASGYANWNFPASVPSTINSSTYTTVCPGAELAIDIHFDAGAPLPPPSVSYPYTHEAFRYYIEINDGGGYSAVLNRTAISAVPGISSISRNWNATIKVPITRWNGGGSTPAFHVKIERSLRNGTTGMWTAWSGFDDFYPGPGDNSPLLNMLKDISTMEFKINGQTVPQSGVMNYTRCNFEVLNVTDIINAGSGATVTIENGNYSGGLFYPTEGPSSPYVVLPHMLAYPFSLHSILRPGGGFYWPVMYSYSGYVKVTVTTTSPCPPYTFSREIIINVTDARATVDFTMIHPSCTYTRVGEQARKNNLAFTSPGTYLSSPPCQDGYLGASSLGIYPTNPTLINAVATTSQQLIVTEVDPTSGIPLGSPIINYTLPSGGGLATSYQFNSFLLGAGNHFITNYDLYKEVKTFKASVKINTIECGLIETYSFFKIMHGGDGSLSPGASFRTTQETETTELKNVVLAYPNPAGDYVFFDCGNIKNDQKVISVRITDLLGRDVKTDTSLPVNGTKATLNICDLPAGSYMYKIVVNDIDYFGKITKN